MKVKLHFIWNLPAIVAALACGMPGQVAAGVGTKGARIPADASLCRCRAFLVAGAGGVGMTSLDGVSWVPKSVLVTTNWRSQCRGKDMLVRVGHDGSLRTSSDLTNWTARESRVPFALHRVAYGSERFVAVGNEGAVVSSDDAIMWTPQDSGTDERLRGVAYGNGLFVAVGYAGTILVSRDGTNWKRRRSPTDVRLLDVAFGNGTFVAVGWHGWILTSPDGSRWRRIRSGTESHLYRVVFRGDLIVERTATRLPCRSGLKLIQGNRCSRLAASRLLVPGRSITPLNRFEEANSTTQFLIRNEPTPGRPA
jgi:hypothetical protein